MAAAVPARPAPRGRSGLYVRLRLDETPALHGDSSAHATAHLRRVWRGHGPSVRTGFVLVAVLAGTFNMWFVFLPAHLVAERRAPAAGRARLRGRRSRRGRGRRAAAGRALRPGRTGGRCSSPGPAALSLLVLPLYVAATTAPGPGAAARRCPGRDAARHPRGQRAPRGAVPRRGPGDRDRADLRLRQRRLAAPPRWSAACSPSGDGPGIPLYLVLLSVAGAGRGASGRPRGTHGG